MRVSVVGGLLLFGHAASAEDLFSLYGGSSFTRNSGLHVKQPAPGLLWIRSLAFHNDAR